MNTDKRFILGIIGFTILVFAGIILLASKTPTTQNGTTALSDDKKALLEIASDDWIKGNKDANVVIVEYLDFECEACGAYYPLVKQLSEEFKNDVAFVNRYFPLPGHKNSLTSASAVEAAGKQGKYWEMHNILFENQKTWGEKQSPDPSIFEGYAQQIGLNMDQFKKDVVSQEVKDRVNRDKNSGTSLGVSGTPSFYLNGEKIPNPKGPDDFKSFIQAAIAKAPKSVVETKLYSLEEIAQHGTDTDCWLAIEGKVYNVTDFVGKHPGGKAILNGCGKDATKLFNERPTNSKGPHPDQAKEVMKEFYIGDLKL
jgi:protein-disulfide isomerase/predicted heme/steroid binding protein